MKKNLDLLLLFILALIVWEIVDPGEMSGWAKQLYHHFF